MFTHSLYSQNQEMPIAFFEGFNKDNIREQIITHLKENPTDTIELCKEFSKKDIRKYYGSEILNFYEVNPKNNIPSLVIMKGDKQYYKALIN
jgi:hypothetical protein